MTRLLRSCLLVAALLCAAVPTGWAQGLTFTFANAQVTTGGTRYEFDVVVTPDAGATGSRLGDTQTYLNYSTAGFGSSIAGASTVTLGTSLQGNGFYVVNNVADNTASRLSVALGYNGAAGNGVALTGATTLFHLSLPIADGSSPAGLSFDAALMTNQQFLDTNATTFTPITATATLNGTLPVELAGFSASVDGRAVVLTWATQSETNNAGFSVETRHSDAATEPWREVQFVEGRGTTAEAAQYSVRAENLAPGRYSFRLRQVDFDGAVRFSPSVEVQVEAPRMLALRAPAPNPVRGTSEVVFTLPITGRATLAIFDLLGREVVRLFDGEGEAGRELRAHVSAADLSAGTYVVRLAHGGAVVSRTLTVVK